MDGQPEGEAPQQPVEPIGQELTSDLIAQGLSLLALTGDALGHAYTRLDLPVITCLHLFYNCL